MDESVLLTQACRGWTKRPRGELVVERYLGIKACFQCKSAAVMNGWRLRISRALVVLERN